MGADGWKLSHTQVLIQMENNAEDGNTELL